MNGSIIWLHGPRRIMRHAEFRNYDLLNTTDRFVWCYW
jgi:hypothetical protein